MNHIIAVFMENHIFFQLNVLYNDIKKLQVSYGDTNFTIKIETMTKDSFQIFQHPDFFLKIIRNIKFSKIYPHFAFFYVYWHVWKRALSEMQFCLSLHTQLHRTSCPFPNTTHAKIEMRVVLFFFTNTRTSVFRHWNDSFLALMDFFPCCLLFSIYSSSLGDSTDVSNWNSKCCSSYREQAWCYGKRNSTILYNIETLREILSERSVQFSWKLWIKTSLTLIQPKQTN